MVFARWHQCAPHLIHASLGLPESEWHLNPFIHFCTAQGSSRISRLTEVNDNLHGFSQLFCPLALCNQKCLLWIGQPRKHFVISRPNHILNISRRNPFIATLIQKLVSVVAPVFFFVYGSVTDEFSDSWNPISKPNSAWICRIQLKLWPFCEIFCLFWPTFGCHGNVL